jgi:hypothetical protein
MGQREAMLNGQRLMGSDGSLKKHFLKDGNNVR